MLSILILFFLLDLLSAPDVVEPVDVLALNEEVKQFLQYNVDSEAQEMTRMYQVLEGIFDKDKLGFVYEMNQTRSAVETFNHAGGNCLSFSLMLVAMARQVNLDVQFQEVDIAPTWSRRGDLVLFSQHVNVVAHIGVRDYEVDLLPVVDQRRVGGRLVSDERAVAHYYNNQGTDHYSKGNSQLAESYFRKALQVDPRTSFVWANLGVVQASQGNLKQAEESYLQALRLNPSEMIAMDNLARLYRRMGDKRRADHYLKKVEKFRNKNPYFHFNLGEIASRKDRFEDAVRHYKAAIKRKSKEHIFYFALARAYKALGETQRAKKSLENARKWAPNESWKSRYDEELNALESPH